MNHSVLILVAVTVVTSLLALEWEPLEIRTQDGRVYPDATVEHVTPSMLDISYVDGDHISLKGISLADLTPELQQAFNYDPQRAMEYQKRLEKYRNIDISRGTTDNLVVASNTQESEAEKIERIRRSIKSRLAGKNVIIDPDDLDYVITAARRAVTVSTVEEAKNGTVVRVLEDQSTREKLPGLIMIHDVKLPGGKPWAGFIYPTGLKARLRGDNELPVFCDSLEDARELLDVYLSIYSEYSLGNDLVGSNEEVPAPDQSIATNDEVNGQAEAVVYDGVYSNDLIYPYYLGGSYWPVYWYRQNCLRWGRRPTVVVPPPKPQPAPLLGVETRQPSKPASPKAVEIVSAPSRPNRPVERPASVVVSKGTVDSIKGTVPVSAKGSTAVAPHSVRTAPASGTNIQPAIQTKSTTLPRSTVQAPSTAGAVPTRVVPATLLQERSGRFRR